MVEGEHWLRKNWTTPVLLLGIFFVALFLRASFPWALAFPDGLLSGGSDSFYYHRIIQHIAENGQYLTFDPRLNFPIGLENPRPPLYAWTTAVAGKALSPFFGDITTAVTFAFLASTAVWGALTVFPMYFVTKEAFGKRAAILAAFFLAVLPAHLQRSAATNGDHDALIQFFVVTGFFFFLRSLKSLHERRWVDDWRLWRKEGRTSLAKGLRLFVSENRKTLLYAMLAGLCVTAVALTWQGWAYAPIILLVYFLFQILVHRFRNQDPMGVTIAFGIVVGLPLLLAAPWYLGTPNQFRTWFDVPLYLYLVAIGIGFVFTATRDYPWPLVLPAVGAVGAAGLFIASLLNPSLAAAFLSGAGYFVQSKAYSTIAEAQPPGLSQIILSFGVATYFLALFGLIWMARGIPRRPAPDYLFVVVWSIAAIFMAQAAARFIFNASPAFAMASAWVTILLIDWLRFDEARKTFRSLGPSLTTLRRSVKARHVFGSLIVIFILLLPNVWYGVDAAIPFERKVEFDRQVYNTFPDFLRPAGYEQTAQSGNSFYFGAFGYSLPLEREYFPAAWSWFRNVDAGINPVERRPAFLSWWDYGFEATDVGAHPTVADNFLDGYHLAGNFITAQSEEEAIALLNMRLLEGAYVGRQPDGSLRLAFDAGTRTLLTSVGLSPTALEAAFRTPEAYVDDVVANPTKYGNYEQLQPANAKYIWGGQYLMDALDADELASMNHALSAILGGSIRYFAVDTRLFPLDGENTGIFYAPAKLSDHRILTAPDGRIVPRDFFDVIAATQRGNVPIEQLRDTDSVTDLTLRYKDMFYNSMFYRAFVGFAPSVAGQSCTDCIPGLPAPTNQQMANIQPMQAWNLSHFRLVYKTAYYNPFPREDIANHTDAWRAVAYTEAADLQGKINRGEATGVVDATPTSLIRRGVVFIKYYDGAFLNGTVRLDGVPWSNVRVTVHDELGIPHDAAVTDASGRYSVLLPFGDIHVAYSLGTPDNRTLTGPTQVHELELAVSDAASMRQDVDEDLDGFVDWKVTRDVDVPGATLQGALFVDVDRDQRLDAGEPLLGGADLTLRRDDVALTRTARTGADGRFRMPGLYPGAYNGTIAWEGRTMSITNVTVDAGQAPKDLPVVPTSIQGYAFDPDGRRVSSALVTLTDLTNGTTFRAISAQDGFFTFTGLLAGAFDATGAKGSNATLPSRAYIVGGPTPVYHNVTLYPAAATTVRTTLGGTPQGFVTLTLEQRSAAHLVRLVTTEANGQTTIPLPAGTWDVYARHYSGTDLWAFVGALTARAGEPATFTASLVQGATIRGVLYNADNRTEVFGGADVWFRGPAGQHRVRTDLSGRYLDQLPLGTWTVQSSYLEFPVYATVTLSRDSVVDFTARRGVVVSGAVFREFLGGSDVPIEDPVSAAALAFSDATRTFLTTTEGDGSYDLALPATGAFALRITRPGFVPIDRPAANAFLWKEGPRFTLLAENITVSGVLSQDGSPAADPSIVLTFDAQGPGAVDARANVDALGGYAVNVQPGRYGPTVDQPVGGDPDIRLQTRDALSVFAAVNADPLDRDIALVVRDRVDGTVTLGGQSRSPVVRFEGPDVRVVNATDGAFSTFLAVGAYTITANLTEGLSTYLALQRLDVTAPTTVSVGLLLATNVSGTTQFGGNPVAGVPVTFTRTEGAAVTGTSDAFGQYHVLVLGGTYAVSVDFAGTTAKGSGVQYVRYVFSGTLTVAQNRTIAVYNLDLAQALDNTTIEGTVRFDGAPVLAQLTFLARGDSGINTTASTGSDGRYSFSLQPGEYRVYAVAGLQRAVALTTYTHAPGATRTLDLGLVPGIRVSGVTTRDGVRTRANVTFSTAAGEARLVSDASGDYTILLPETSYTVEASTGGTERGLSVTYRATASLVLAEPTPVNLDLTKAVRRQVDLMWDAAQKATIPPGGVVTYALTVTNLGNADDTVQLGATGVGFTFSFNDDRVEVPFGTTGNTRTVQLTITANGDAKVEHPPISITASSTADPGATKAVAVQVDVVRYRGMRADVSSDAPTWDGRFLNYSLEVRNLGNGQETFRLTLPNEDELTAAGWRATFVGLAGTPQGILNLTVPANATQRPVLRLEKLGGPAGATAHVQITSTEDGLFSTLVRVRLQMPALAVDGRIGAVGTGVTGFEPGIDLATAALLVSFVAVVGAAAYLSILRRRSR